MKKKKITCVKDCFDENGMFAYKFDPYDDGEDDGEDGIFAQLFDIEGYVNYDAWQEVLKLIRENKWNFECDAVKYYYSEMIDTGCDGSGYTAVYGWRY